MPPKVSVIIPTYNRPADLKDAVSSVLNQTLEDFELLIVDDASDLDIEPIVDSYNDDRVEYLSHENNQGGSAARNTGIQHSSGTYIAFLDDDDTWMKTKLEEQIKYMESQNCKASYSNFKFESKFKIVNIVLSYFDNHSSNKPSGGADLIPYIISGCISLGGASTMIIKKSILKEIDGFDESYDRLQDWELIVRVLKITDIEYIDKKLVKKVGYNPPSGRSIEISWRKFKKDFPEEIDKSIIRGLKPEDNMSFTIARSYIRDGDFISGFRHLTHTQFLNTNLILSLSFSIILGIIHKAKTFNNDDK